jgi:hypothetical protein
MSAFDITPFDVEQESVKALLTDRQRLAAQFLRIPGATVTVMDWRSLDNFDKVALIRAGMEVEAERLYKQSQVLSGDPIALADAISEADGGMLRDRLRLTQAVAKASARMVG